MSHEKHNTKVIVTATDGMTKPADMFAKIIADKLGVCCEDVIVLQGVSSIAFAEVPAALTQAKTKADAEAQKKADAETKAAADAEATKSEPAKVTHKAESKKA